MNVILWWIIVLVALCEVTLSFLLNDISLIWSLNMYS